VSLRGWGQLQRTCLRASCNILDGPKGDKYLWSAVAARAAGMVTAMNLLACAQPCAALMNLLSLLPAAGRLPS
jgi:hypothetical protein